MLKKLIKSTLNSLLIAVITIILSLSVFIEILKGPSFFGGNSYSFNFPKIDYSKEIYNFPQYKALLSYPKGLFFIKDGYDVLNFPYSQSVSSLMSLNYENYFYGCNQNSNFSQDTPDELKLKADYILSVWPITHPDYKLLDTTSMSVLRKHQSNSVFEILDSYGALQKQGWDDDVFIYKTNCGTDCRLKNLSNNPISFGFRTEGLQSEPIATSINYSKWWVDVNNKNTVITKDRYGLMEIKPGGNDVKLYFVSPYILAGFAVSLASFVAILNRIKTNDKRLI